GIVWQSAEVSDPKNVDDADNVTLTIKGIPEAKSGDFRNLVGTEAPTYVLTSVNSTDYSLKLKTSELQDLKKLAVAGSIDTISNRINDMGVAETSVQPYGQADYQVLIQLPGVDDPAAARRSIETAGYLYITGV